MPESGAELTVSQTFQQQHLVQWWNNNVGQGFGENGEEGTDFDMGVNTPVGAIAGGIVTFVGAPYANDPQHSSFGYGVMIHATDGMYWYQHLHSTALRIGNAVDVGAIVGLSGGCSSYYNKYPQGQGGACIPNSVPGCTQGWQDCWSSGAHIEVRWTPQIILNKMFYDMPWVDPYGHFQQIAQEAAVLLSSAKVGTGSNPTTLPIIGPVLQGIQDGTLLGGNPLATNADVAQVFSNLDTLLHLQNPLNASDSGPFNTPFLGGIMNYFVNGLAITFYDIVALVMRTIIILTGVYLLWKVINHFANISGTIGAATQTAFTAAKIGVAAAA